ncbi:uncharacterized protein LOC18448819 isoform X3 [Amborella trichopoda]|uniref:uncharacterized protein LOC18448819 isoform X3 n=1 Tax=Amborella trichopoda TaxID=13333 RepID=UPI0009C13D5F|nr:uncharacterized protein LOC18448819 isoform X3 [Amborella trichopoda]|eukprot:XP_020532115.1 uncharacterized protein LOC18448819 isoform X3 [Amborella trichopoda]
MQSGRRRLLQHLLAAAPASALRPPWSALQNRGAKVLGTTWEHHPKERAYIPGTKSTTYSAWKRWSNNTGVFVEDKSFQFLYQEGHSVTVMEPDTFEQMEVSKDLFGKRAAYLKDGMTVTVQLYDGKPMSASVPQRVTCTVVEAQTIAKGQTLTPQYKKVVLDNGLTVLAPAFIKTGDVIVVNTNDDSYMTRAKE